MIIFRISITNVYKWMVWIVNCKVEMENLGCKVGTKYGGNVLRSLKHKAVNIIWLFSFLLLYSRSG